MKTYSLSHLADDALLRDLAVLVARDRATTAALLAHLAEVDDRKLYLPAGYPSMHAYCVGELRMSEDGAFKRIKAARAARACPAIFDAVADGRLHLSTVVLLAPHTHEKVAPELVKAVTHKTKVEVEQILAERYPRSEEFTWIEERPSFGPHSPQQAPGPVEKISRRGQVPAAGQANGRTKVNPVAPERFALHVMMDTCTRDKLRHVQALLSHQIPSGDLSEVLDRVLDLAIHQLERRKFAATTKPSRRQPSPVRGRSVPNHVKRAVWERDGGQCTYVGNSGHRCSAREFIEFDHVDPVARGGRATVDRVRLRCRAHNQYGAERTFGRGFMNQKRQAARAATEARKKARQHAEEVIPWLRRLGIGASEARRAAELCERIPDAPIEARVRLALSCFGRGTRQPAPTPPAW